MTTNLPVTTGRQLGRRSWAEPWKIKMVELLGSAGVVAGLGVVWGRVGVMW